MAINGFFVAGEFALVAVNRSRVESKAAEGDRKAKRLLARLKDLSFELSGAQLGITVTSLIIGFVAEDTIAELIRPALDRLGVTSIGLAVLIALILATLFQMVFGELAPKNIAIAKSYPTAIRVGLAMAFVNRILRPLIVFFNRAANWTVRLVGIEPKDELAGLRSLQELEMIVRASSDRGELDDRETSLLTRAISFSERDAADAMIPRVEVHGVPREATVADVRALSVETGHSRFPVYGDNLDDIVGVAYVKDTFRLPAERRATTPVSEIVADAHVVPESMPLDTLLIDMQRSHRTFAVVADEYGGTAGIVTVEDIVEEILGEIEDEHDAPATRRRGDVLGGSLHRHEVLERTGFEWPEGGYDTLNGFVTDRLERFPEVGDVVDEAGYRIEVVSVVDHLADRMTVRRISKGQR